MKPVLFCDFDGVINQFPYRYERDTDGSHDVAIEYGGMMNYGFRREWFDDSKFFEPTDFVMLDTIKDIFPIFYSSEMVERIRNLILEDKVKFVWLTTWREEAVRLLNPLFGFPEGVTFIPWMQKLSDYNHAGKAHAVMNYFEEDLSRRDGKMVWLDDVATKGFETWSDSEGFFDSKATVRFGFPDDSLVMVTNEFFGITRSGMSTIENFVS